MRKVFEIDTEAKGSSVITDRFTYHVFGEDILEAIKKVSDCISGEMQIVNAKLLCIIEEDKDLEEYKKE